LYQPGFEIIDILSADAKQSHGVITREQLEDWDSPLIPRSRRHNNLQWLNQYRDMATPAEKSSLSWHLQNKSKTRVSLLARIWVDVCCVAWQLRPIIFSKVSFYLEIVDWRIGLRATLDWD